MLKFQALRILVSSAWNLISKRLKLESPFGTLAMRLRSDKGKLLLYNLLISRTLTVRAFSAALTVIAHARSFVQIAVGTCDIIDAETVG